MENKEAGRILVVDDQELNRNVCFENLEELEGYKVYLSENGQEALDFLEEEQVDLILLDIMMPVLDGHQTLIKIKKNPKTTDIPVLMLTAKASSDSIVQCFKEGASDYLTKPFNIDELVARVYTLVKLKQSQNEIIKYNEKLECLVEERTKKIEKLLEEVKETDKIKNDFLLLMSHNNRTPLNGIIGFAGFLIDSPDMPREKIIKSANMIYDCGQQMLDSIQKILLYSNIKNIKDLKNVIKSTDNLEKYFVDFQTKYQQKIIDKNLVIQLKIEDLSFVADWEILSNAIEFIFENAIIFSKTDSEIYIEGKTEKDNYVLKITDKGEGISAEQINEIFTAFSTKDINHHHKGNKISLAICKMIVELHNGSIDVESKVGEGSTFIVRIPIVIESSKDDEPCDLSKVIENLGLNGDVAISQELADKIRSVVK